MRTVILYKIMPLVPQVAAPVMMDRARLATYVTTCQRRRSPLAALRQLPSSPLLPSPLLSILLFSPPPSLPPPLPFMLPSPLSTETPNSAKGYQGTLSAPQRGGGGDPAAKAFSYIVHFVHFRTF